VTFIDEDKCNVEVDLQGHHHPAPLKATFDVTALVPCPEIEVDGSVWHGDVATSLLRNVSLLLSDATGMNAFCGDFIFTRFLFLF
jgi:hypothetical protein